MISNSQTPDAIQLVFIDDRLRATDATILERAVQLGPQSQTRAHVNCPHAVNIAARGIRSDSARSSQSPGCQTSRTTRAPPHRMKRTFPRANCTYLTMSHGSLWRFGSLRNCQFSSYVGSGYCVPGPASEFGPWLVKPPERPTRREQSCRQRDNISVLLHERLKRGNAAQVSRSTLESKIRGAEN